jgi:beta-lactamase class A
MRPAAHLAVGLLCVGVVAAEARQGLTVVEGPAVDAALRPAPGRPLLVHLWASWCKPCVEEWPSLAEWLRRSPDRGVDVATLAVDEPDSLPAARKVLASLGHLPGRTLAASLDDAFPVIRRLDPEWDGSLPATFLVDAQGALALSQHGLTHLDAIEAAIERVTGAPVDLSERMGEIASEARGRVGAAALIVETGEGAALRGDDRFPMQSVYKLPIAMATLEAVDAGRLRLDEPIRVGPEDLLPVGHSPIRDSHPRGIELDLAELLRLAVSESDGTASDVLLRLVGGPSRVQAYLATLGTTDLIVANTEKEIQGSADVQYRNWARPRATVHLLRELQLGHCLSAASQAVLLRLMTETATGSRRLKGLLPGGTLVAHKTGTSGTSPEGVTAATNDVGLVALPDGRHLAVAVFVSDSRADRATREGVIARITRAAWDWSRTPSPSR